MHYNYGLKAFYASLKTGTRTNNFDAQPPTPAHPKPSARNRHEKPRRRRYQLQPYHIQPILRVNPVPYDFVCFTGETGNGVPLTKADLANTSNRCRFPGIAESRLVGGNLVEARDTDTAGRVQREVLPPLVRRRRQVKHKIARLSGILGMDIEVDQG